MSLHFGSPLLEQRALTDGTGFALLDHLSVVRVTGPDRLSFLHALTSQDLANLRPDTPTETLVLSPQGRIEHTAAVIDDGQATWLLTETAPTLAGWLASMRFRSAVQVEDVTADWALFGACRRLPDAASGGPGAVVWRDPWPGVTTGGTRYGPSTEEHPGRGWRWHVHLLPAREPQRVEAWKAVGLIQAGSLAVDALRLAAWRPRFSTEVDDRSLPHELDCLRTAVHLHKGCYRGQEAVARVHNLGHPPRRLTFLHLDGSGHELPPVGSAVTTAEGAEVGRVTSVAQHFELGPIGLALLKRTAEPTATLLVEGISATQQAIVSPAGVTPDRPAPRGPLTRGLMSPGRSMAGVKPGVRITRTADG
ncbi:MAG: folate-binding protein [Promicromonosporaceae bacterium]|nr:folate-binding protein [Promicromonosporaceae bacterium]